MNALPEQAQGRDTVYLFSVYKHHATLTSVSSLANDGRNFWTWAEVWAVYLSSTSASRSHFVV